MFSIAIFDLPRFKPDAEQPNAVHVSQNSAMRRMPPELWQSVVDRTSSWSICRTLHGSRLAWALGSIDPSDSFQLQHHRSTLKAQAELTGALNAPKSTDWSALRSFAHALNPQTNLHHTVLSPDVNTAPAGVNEVFFAANKKTIEIVASSRYCYLGRVKPNGKQWVLVSTLRPIFLGLDMGPTALPAATFGQREGLFTSLWCARENLVELDFGGSSLTVFFPAKRPELHNSISIYGTSAEFDDLYNRRLSSLVNKNQISDFFLSLVSLKYLRLSGPKTNEVTLQTIPLRQMPLEVLDVCGCLLEDFDWIKDIQAKYIYADDLEVGSQVDALSFTSLQSVSSHVVEVSMKRCPVYGEDALAIVEASRALEVPFQFQFSTRNRLGVLNNVLWQNFGLHF